MPYIGARISLISQLHIRYEGVLYTIDPKAQTVALQNVRCFGTESRQAASFVPPSTDVFEFIIFGAKDIKDLSVLQSESKPAFNDPAIVSSHAAPTAQMQAQHSQQIKQQSGTAGDEHDAGDRRGGGRGGGGGGGGAGKQHTVRVISEVRSAPCARMCAISICVDARACHNGVQQMRALCMMRQVNPFAE